MKILALMLALLLAMPAGAVVFDVRGDAGDTGLVTVVDEINKTKTVNYDEVSGPYPARWDPRIKSSQGDSWGPAFAGQTISCEYYGAESNNPVRRYSNQTRSYRQDPDKPGYMPNGKTNGSPSIPLRLIFPVSERSAIEMPRLTGRYDVYQYPWGPGGGHGMASSSNAAYVGQGCGDHADDPWSYLFEIPVTAFEVVLSVAGCGHVGEKLHIEGWQPDGTHAFHMDITDLETTGCPNKLTVAFASEVPIAGFSTWVQNGPGVMWWEVSSGTPIDAPGIPLTLEERVEHLESLHGIE